MKQMNAADDTGRYATADQPGAPRPPARWQRVSGSRVALAAAGVLALAMAGPSFAATGHAAASRPAVARRAATSRAKAAGTKKKAPACVPALWTDPPHTATTSDTGFAAPQLSLLAGNMATIDHGTVLQVSLTVSDLTDSVPIGATAEDWYMTWTYKGTTYFGQAQLSAVPGSTPTFGDGDVVKTGGESEYSENHTDAGKFVTGKDGQVIIDVPLANVGKPPMGASLGYPAGATYTEEGIPPNPAASAASLQAVDSGGPNNPYSVGMTTGTCR